MALIFDKEEVLEVLDNDTEVFKEIVQTYIEVTDELLVNLKKCLERKDLKESCSLCHNLTGSSSSSGVVSISKLSEKAKENVKDGDYKKALVIHDEMERDFLELKEVFKTL